MRGGLFILLIIAILCFTAAAQRRSSTGGRARSPVTRRAPTTSRAPSVRAPTRPRPQRPISRTPQRQPQRQRPQRPISRTPQRQQQRPTQPQRPQYPTAQQSAQQQRQRPLTQQPRLTQQQQQVMQQQERMAMQQARPNRFGGFFGNRNQAPQQRQMQMPQQRPMGLMGNPQAPAAPRLSYDMSGMMGNSQVTGGRPQAPQQPRQQAPPMAFQPGQQLNRVQTRDVLLRAMRDAGITNPRAQANILANIEVESRMVPRSESMNYSPEQLRRVFPRYFNPQQAQQYGRTRARPANQEGIANRAYGNRMGNGPNEGYMYRGRGYIQLTGKDNYSRYGQRIGENLVQNPDLVNRPDIAARVAAEYFAPYPQQQLTDINRVIQIVGPADTASFPERRRLANNWYNEINGLQ